MRSTRRAPPGSRSSSSSPRAANRRWRIISTTRPSWKANLKKSGKNELLEILKSTNMDSGAIAYVRQNRPLGLGHAVWCARRLIGDEPFAVLLPDDVIAAEKPCLQQMVEAYAETGGNMVAAMEVPPEKASSYGVLDIGEDMGAIVRAKGMVEKPKADEAAVEPGGDRALYPVAQGADQPEPAETGRGRGNPADRRHRRRGGSKAGNGVYGFRFRGQRYDCGSKGGLPAGHRGLWPGARNELRDEFQQYPGGYDRHAEGRRVRRNDPDNPCHRGGRLHRLACLQGFARGGVSAGHL
jgi:UTP--glucose-1-phosphate uridylyltransferase